jgi:flagellin
MPTVINTNLASLFAQNSLSNAQNNLAQSVQRLSSGLRINSAKDDAAGLSISQNMQSQINGTNQSIRNLSDATNLLQVADSSLSTIQDMMLRLKQLATQGYDGSLSTSQKLNIVQEMKDLNSEINATAARTAFNGINLLSSGSSVDLVNSDLQSGSVMTDIPTAIDIASGLGKYSSSGLAANAAIGLADAAQTGGTASTYAVILDPALSTVQPGTYTLTSVGNQLTMTGNFNGLAQSQTVIVEDVNNNTGTSNLVKNQNLDFSNFGVNIALSSTVIAGMNQTGAQLASKFAGANYNQVVVSGNNSVISGVSLSGVAPGTYTFSAANALTGANVTNLAADKAAAVAGGNVLVAGTYNVKLSGGTGSGGMATIVVSAGAVDSITFSGGGGYTASDVLTVGANQLGAGSKAFNLTGLAANSLTGGTNGDLTLSGTINGVPTTQKLSLSQVNAQSSADLNFASFGVKLSITANQQTSAAKLSGEIAGLNSLSNSTRGQLVVSQGNNSALKFQSGANSDAFIQIDTINVQTGTTGTYAGNASEMTTLGNRITSSGAGNLGTLGLNDTIDTWQTAFKNAAAAVDNALEYISTQRATYGSQMNRLSYVSTNLQAQSTNLQNSRSAIIDTDFAAETAKLTKGQIMQQAATAMLAQANQMPNVILSLLK